MAKINKVFGNNKKITTTCGVLLAGFIAGSALGSEITYNGTKTDLKALENNLSDLLGIDTQDEGLINQSSNNGDVVIDYSEGTVPKFVIGGYSNIGSEVKKNNVTLKQGDIDGPVYGGLSHDINIGDDARGPTWNAVNNLSKDIATSVNNKNIVANSNTIKIYELNTKVRTLTGGLAYMNVTSGNVYAGGNASSQIDANAYVATRAKAEKSKLFANSNRVEISDNVNARDVIGGEAKLHIKTGTATAYKTNGPRSANSGSLTYASADTIFLYANDRWCKYGKNNRGLYHSDHRDKYCKSSYSFRRWLNNFILHH